MTYTRDDLIIWPDDPRLKDAVGKDVYFGDSPRNVLRSAMLNEKTTRLLMSIKGGFGFPFEVYKTQYPCIIIKKEPEKHYIPFDFSLKEDRNTLMGKRIAWKDGNGAYEEETITSIRTGVTHDCWLANNKKSEILLEKWTFVDGSDAGKPVGKEVEE